MIKRTIIILIFFSTVFFTNCNHSESMAGDFVLNNTSQQNIAEILELKSNNDFVFSGLKNDSGYVYTWVMEGVWELKADSISLKSGDAEKMGYGKNINYEFISFFRDSVEWLDQAGVVSKGMKFLIEGEQILREGEEGKLYYDRTILLKSE